MFAQANAKLLYQTQRFFSARKDIDRPKNSDLHLRNDTRIRMAELNLKEFHPEVVQSFSCDRIVFMRVHIRVFRRTYQFMCAYAFVSICCRII